MTGYFGYEVSNNPGLYLRSSKSSSSIDSVRSRRIPSYSADMLSVRANALKHC